MAIEAHIDSEGNTFYQYREPTKEALYEEISSLCELLKDLTTRLKEIDFRENVRVNEYVFSSLAIRVDKRREYFLIFHKQTRINEIKKAALYAYWILKFKPISVINIDKYSNINEIFAFHVICSAIREKTGKRINVSGDYVKELMYAFKYWDLSKEALILIAETLCELVDKAH